MTFLTIWCILYILNAKDEKLNLSKRQELMKVTIIEGTPQELKALMPTLFSDSSVIQQEAEQEPILEPKEAYRAMLTRIDIQQGQLDLYRVLSKGELEYNDYLGKMKRTRQEIAGVHGALGKRINNTKEIHQAGLPGNTSAIMDWRKENGKEYLKLNQEFIEVLEEEKII